MIYGLWKILCESSERREAIRTDRLPSSRRRQNFPWASFLLDPTAFSRPLLCPARTTAPVRHKIWSIKTSAMNHPLIDPSRWSSLLWIVDGYLPVVQLYVKNDRWEGVRWWRWCKNPAKAQKERGGVCVVSARRYLFPNSCISLGLIFHYFPLLVWKSVAGRKKMSIPAP